MKYVMILMILSVVILTACTEMPTDLPACTEDAKVCSDGTAVVRDPTNNCQFPACSDEKSYVSKDLEQCKLIKYMCVDGKQPFTDEQGCGCEPIEGKLQAYDCTEPRIQACTREYMPVCGQVQIQCITTPCNPIMQTFSNKCEACANSLTISYTEGACENNAAGGTVLAGTPEEQCTSIGGTYSQDECLGISQEQCQEIGGQFNECASACRNNPDPQAICAAVCIHVCEFK